MITTNIFTFLPISISGLITREAVLSFLLLSRGNQPGIDTCLFHGSTAGIFYCGRVNGRSGLVFKNN